MKRECDLLNDGESCTYHMIGVTFSLLILESELKGQQQKSPSSIMFSFSITHQGGGRSGRW